MCRRTDRDQSNRGMDWFFFALWVGLLAVLFSFWRIFAQVAWG